MTDGGTDGRTDGQYPSIEMLSHLKIVFFIESGKLGSIWDNFEVPLPGIGLQVTKFIIYLQRHSFESALT